MNVTMTNRKSSGKSMANLGWRVPESAKDRFTTFCDRKSQGYQGNAAGALFLWPFLPSRLREWAILSAHEDPEAPDEVFWAGFASAFDATVEQMLKDLSGRKPKRDKG